MNQTTNGNFLKLCSPLHTVDFKHVPRRAMQPLQPLVQLWELEAVQATCRRHRQHSTINAASEVKGCLSAAIGVRVKKAHMYVYPACLAIDKWPGEFTDFIIKSFSACH